jgi:hypothetical protein
VSKPKPDETPDPKSSVQKGVDEASEQGQNGNDQHPTR